MSENVTFFGDYADDFDDQLSQAERFLDAYVEKEKYSTRSMLTASSIVAFMRFGQSFVDLLRIGNGLDKGGWRGVGADALRLITIAGVAGAGIGRLSKILAVTQAEGTVTCTWISTANALQRTGQRFFVSVKELMKLAGVDADAINAAGGTTVQYFSRLVAALQKASIPVEEIKPASSAVGVIEDILASRPSGVMVFAVEYEVQGVRAAHQLMATLGDAGLTIIDTNGKIFRTIQGFSKVYENAKLINGMMFYIKNAALITGANIAATAAGFERLVIELLPVKFKAAMLDASPVRRGLI